MCVSNTMISQELAIPTRAGAYLCVRLRMYVCMYVFVCVLMYVYVYVCIDPL